MELKYYNLSQAIRVRVVTAASECHVEIRFTGDMVTEVSVESKEEAEKLAFNIAKAMSTSKTMIMGEGKITFM